MTQEPLAKPRPSATQCCLLPLPPGVCHFVNLPEHGAPRTDQPRAAAAHSSTQPDDAQVTTGDCQGQGFTCLQSIASRPCRRRQDGGPHFIPQTVCWGHFLKRWACHGFCGHTLVRQGTGIEGGKGPGPRVAAPEGERNRTTDTTSCPRQPPTPGVCSEARGSPSPCCHWCSFLFLVLLNPRDAP